MKGVVGRRCQIKSGQVVLAVSTGPYCPLPLLVSHARAGAFARLSNTIPPIQASEPIRSITCTRRKTGPINTLFANSICSTASVLSHWPQLVNTLAPP